MKFSEMKYERVSKDAAIEKIKDIISRVEAATSGEGSALRLSANSNKEFLYYAKKYPEFYIRTSIPYKYEKIEIAHNNYEYQYAILILILILFLTLFKFP